MKIRLFKGFAILAGLISLVLSAEPVQAAGLRTLHGHIPRAISRMNLQPVGNLAQTRRLHLAIGLPLHNQESLTNLLRQIYDPASPNYHHYLTPKQFTKMFGPSEQDYQSVMAFAKANGFAVGNTYSNRMLLDVSGTVADIEKAFHVRMRLYQHPKEKRDFYAPDVEPSVPSTIPVLDISGLNNYATPHPNYVSIPWSSVGKALDGSGPGGTYMGSDFRNAYAPGVSLTGAGQTVALVQFDGYLASDIQEYEALAGLPNVPLENVLLDGFNGVPTGNGGEVEVSLDIEMAISMAPGLSKVIVYEGNPYNFIPNNVLSRIANDDLAKQVSCSWGWTGGPSQTTDNIFLQMAAQGQSFFVASGDSDAYPPGTVDDPANFGTPADSPYVTSVGGTTLSTTNGDWLSETVWNWGNEYPNQGYDGVGSSGGTSSAYTIPSWQTNIDMTANQGSTNNRNFPDVAMTADNVFVVADNGTWYPLGGTSCASPLWAGFTALMNEEAATFDEPPVGFLNPKIYALADGLHYTSDFHDITTGNNEWSGSPSQYSAVSGYDLCTGLGTPNGQNLINDLVGKRIGVLQISAYPPTGSALLQGTAQPISITVDDVYGVTNANVMALVTNNLGTVVATLTLTNASNQSIYNASLSVPASTNPLTMIVMATAPGEIGITNVYNYLVIGAPPNDNFANATKVPALGGSYVENNRFATLETDEPYHDGDQNQAASVWWSWMPTSDTNVFVDTVGSAVDNVLAVYTGSSLVSLQSVAATRSTLTSYKPAQLNFDAQAGTTYYIAVAGANATSVGSISLHITPGGHPDTNAPVVSVISPQSGTNVLSNLISITGTASDPGVNPSGLSQLFVTINGFPLTVIGTTNWTALVPLQQNLNVIKVRALDRAGNFSATRTVEVNYLAPYPINDFFASATPLTSVPSPILATNTAATREVGEPDPAGNPGGKSLWWTFTPSSDSIVSLNTSGSTFDTVMALYAGVSITNLTPVAANDDAYSGAPGGYSEISQAVKAGQKYYVQLDGYDGASGTINLNYAFHSSTVYNLTVVTNLAGGTVQLMTTNSTVLPGTSGNFASGSPVILTAFPNHGYKFDSWTVDSTNNSANPLTVRVNKNMIITANFAPEVFTDGFESGGFSHLAWKREGDALWIVQTNVVDVGQYAAQSGAIGDSQSSSLILSNTFVAGTGSFDFKVSSEANWDFLNFYVDGVLLAQWSGEAGWANYSFPLTAGPHTLKWSYAKDATISLGADAAYLDDVILPIGVSPSITTAKLQLQQQPGGGLIMHLVGQTNQEYVIQVSSDLVHWQNVSTNTASGGIISVPVMPNDTNRAQFYRAVAPGF